jgi:acetolactate synthase I/II/III large subunit
MNEQLLQFAEALSQQEIKALFGIPGSGLSWQLISAAEERGIPFWNVSHEAAGAIMAGAFGRQTGSLGCCLSIKGPGVANMLAGMVSNQYEQWATLGISEAFSPAAPPFRMHKRLDHGALLSTIHKAYATAGDPVRVIGRLADTARAEIPGPVHLDLFLEDAPRFHLYRAAPQESADAQARWDNIRRRVERAVKPVVIAGSLATRCEWGRRLSALQVPVFTTTAAKGVLDECSPWAAGVFTGEGKQLAPESQILPRADLVVGLGLRNLEVLTPRKLAPETVMIDAADPVAAAGFEADEILTTADAALYTALLDSLEVKSWKEQPVGESTTSLCRYLTRDEWLPGRVFVELGVLIPEDSCLVVDSGSFCTVAEHAWHARTARAFLASSNGKFMGTSLPMAIGAALADRSRPIICAVGDGGIQSYTAELKLAVAQKLPILFLLMTDGRYGSIAATRGAAALSLRAITMAQPSWFRAVEGLGCASAQVTCQAELTAWVRDWKPGEGPLFLEAVFDPERYAGMTAQVR